MKIILIVIVILIVLVVALWAYYGGFKKISFRTEVQGGETVVYEDVTGDYSQSAAVTKKIYHSLLNDEKIATTKGFGIYYDDPKKVEKSKLRSEVGCIVENLDSATLAILSAKYKVKTLPRTNCAVTEFPFKGQMSMLVAIMKVYPAFNQYIKEKGIAEGPIMEIYDVPNGKILYRKEFVLK